MHITASAPQHHHHQLNTMYHPPNTADPRVHNGIGSSGSMTSSSYTSTSPVASSRFPGGSVQPTPQSLMGSMAPPSAYPPPTSGSSAGSNPTPGLWYPGGGGDQQPRLPPLPHMMPSLDQVRQSPQAPSATITTTPALPPHGRIITVYGNGFVPQQGPEHTHIAVTCDLNFPLLPGTNGNGNLVRLIIGDKDVDTQVTAPTPQNNCYLVSAEVPSLDDMTRRGMTVEVYMEALTERHGVHERISLGEFQVTSDSRSPGSTGRGAKRSGSPKLKQNRSASAKLATPRDRRRPARDGYMSALPNSFVYDSPPPSPQPGLVRTTQMHGGAPVSNNPYVVRTKARLEVEGNLNDMKCGWTSSMWQNRRSLVQFTRRQVGATVHASFKPVEERDWQPNMIVISCLWHEARGECYFTSVDAIYLLECLMATRYTTEEKNRIRRNLESFKPTTLQKNEGQWQDFYAHIMSYPNPKPRNIDKGLKVFPWCHLEQALKKIFGNYSAFIAVQYPYGNTPDPNGPAPSFSLHTPSDTLSYTEDRSSHTGVGGGSSDSVPTYVDMSSGNTNPSDQREFSNYVNISPATTPAYTRDFSNVGYQLPSSSGSGSSDALTSQYGFPSVSPSTTSAPSYTPRGGPNTYPRSAQAGPTSTSPTTNTHENPYTHAHTYPAS